MSDRLLFSSKIDLWILILILAPVAVCVPIAAQNWPQVVGARWWLGLVLLIGIAVPLWVLLTTRYSMTDSELHIGCGPFKWTIAIKDIESVEPCRDALSSPALSLDRVRIDYGDGQRILISPEPRKGFLQQLEFRRRQVSTESAQASTESAQSSAS